MRACRAALGGLVLGAATTVLAAGSVDPQMAVERAREALAAGDLERAETATGELAALLEDSAWDPEGSIARGIVPELEARMARLRSLRAEIATARAGWTAAPPHAVPADAEGWIAHVRSEAAAMRAALERVVAGAAPGAERGALLQSEAFRGASAAAATGALDTLARTWVERHESAFDRDERIRALKAKQDALKRDLVEASVERADLEGRIEALQRLRAELERRMVDFIGFEAADPKVPFGEERGGVLDRALASRIREIWMDLRAIEAQAPGTKAACSAEIERFRLANHVSISGGGLDQTTRIDALAAALDAVPVSEPARGRDASSCRR